MDPAGALDGLGEDGGDGRALAGEHPGHRLQVVAAGVDDVADQGSEARPVRDDALRRGAAVRGAVVAAVAGDHGGPFRVAVEDVGQAGELHGRVDRLGPRVGEEHPGVRHRCPVGDELGQAVSRPIGPVPEGVVGGEVAHLLVDRLDHFGAAVPDVHAPQRGDGVEVLLAALVHHDRATTRDEAHEV